MIDSRRARTGSTAAFQAAQDRMAEAGAEAQARQQQELMAGAGQLLGSLLGGRSRSRGLSALGKMMGGGSAQTAKAQQRAQAAAAKAQDVTGDLAELERELAAEITAITTKWDAVAAEVETVPIRLESSDAKVTSTTLLWIPTA